MVTLDLTASGGSVQTSGEIAYNADATGGRTSVQGILEAMKNLGPGSIHNVTSTYDLVSGSTYTYTWNVTFSAAFGDVPEMFIGEADADLSSVGADVNIATVQDGNVIGGDFRLGFSGYTTSTISYDATASELGKALADLPSIDSVDVERLGPDDQGGFNWTVTFTSDNQDGDLPLLTVEADDITTTGAFMEVYSLEDGSYLDGFVNVTFAGNSSQLAANATAEEMRVALEALGTGGLAVSREGPDNQQGYVWTVNFLETEGDVDIIEVHGPDLTGDGSAVVSEEVRKGTWQEIQTIVVTAANDLLAVDNSTYFVLSFGGEVTGPILANGNGSCEPAVSEVQVISTSTSDTTSAGGDAHVSYGLAFQLVFYSRDGVVTLSDTIDANPSFGDCSEPAESIQDALREVEGLEGVTVSSNSTSAGDSCDWFVTFTDTPGNQDQVEWVVDGWEKMADKNVHVRVDTLSISMLMAVVIDTEGPASSVTFGDDTVTVGTLINGTVDSIKLELELLPAVGEVTVHARENETTSETCTWDLVFETNTGLEGDGGELPLITAAFYNITNSSYSDLDTTVTQDMHEIVVSRNRSGTSVHLGGDFALSLDGSRSQYLPSNASARDVKLALEALDTVGTVDVERYDGDEEVYAGYTWIVTFNTDLGDVSSLTADTMSMTGSAPVLAVSESVKGVAPSFASLDPYNSLPLGSATLTDLSDLSMFVAGLEEGVAYYFRVTASNYIGAGPPAVAETPYAIPLPQPSQPPSNITLEAVDGGTLRVDFSPPSSTGGEEVDSYRVEYSTSPFFEEAQALTISCESEPEVQVVTTNATAVPEVQLLHLKMDDNFTADYPGTTVFEVQAISCDASAGTFTLTFDGAETDSINFDADEAGVISALEEISTISEVNVTFKDGVSQACQAYPSSLGFNVTFLEAVNYRGDVPLMTSNIDNLEGARRADVTEVSKGYASMGGTFKLTFNGHTTDSISYNAGAADIQAELEALDPIGYLGVNVTSAGLSAQYEKMWRVSFVGSTVEGDVEAMQALDYNTALTGNGAAVAIYADGEETSSDRRGADPSVVGNQLSGTFTLTLRGWETESIDFNAADTEMEVALEALPNVGSVSVNRKGPDGQLGYSWYVTFVENPGSFPAGSGDVALLSTDSSSLGGDGAWCTVEEMSAGTPELSGAFVLAFTASDDGGSGGVTRYTDELPYNSLAEEVEASLEALDEVGNVVVTRTTHTDGYTWTVTFASCRANDTSGADVCNTGDVELISFAANGSLSGCYGGSGPASSSMVVVNGSAGEEVDMMDLSDGPPYRYDITGLEAGTAIYARVSAHTLMSYGYAGLSKPEFATPSNVQPGPPAAVRLVETSESSIAVEWDHPTVDGGADIAGYELWMGEWATSSFRLVYDGVDDEDTTSFTVDTSNFPELESGRAYRFKVRAVNYCSAVDTGSICYGDFSPSTAYTVREPRMPSAPTQPLRDSLTNLGTAANDDAEVGILWSAPMDNGGSEVLSYKVRFEDQAGTLTSVDVDAGDVWGAQELLVSSLSEGELYTFYVQAVNAYGTSGASPALTVVAALRSGMAVGGNQTYATVSPTVLAVSSSEVTLSWAAPVDTGKSPVTGYHVYMFDGVGLNSQADPEPVKHEIQLVSLSVDDPVPAIQDVTISDVAGGTFTLRVMADALGGEIDVETAEIGYSASAAAVELALEAASSTLGDVEVARTISGTGTTITYEITFDGYTGAVEDLVLDTTELEADSGAVVSAEVITLQEGTEPLQGDFSLIYRGHETAALSYDADATEASRAAVKRQLENLDTVGIVSVERNTTLSDGASEWTVTFETELGDLPMLETTSGRLTGGGREATVTETLAGSAATLVYDGSGKSSVKEFTASGLVEDSLYAFKVVPLSAVGLGIPSAASPTVVAREGAVAAQTVASGPSLAQGMAGVVHEQQTVTATATSGNFWLSVSGGGVESVLINADVTNGNVASDAEIKAALDGIVGEVNVSSFNASHSGQQAYAWTVTFMSISGDVGELIVNETNILSGDVAVTERVKGQRNEFVVSPRKATGAPVTDVTAASAFAAEGSTYSFAGGDLFFTELYKIEEDGSIEWESDGGVAMYNPTAYETQRLWIPSGSSGSFCLVFEWEKVTYTTGNGTGCPEPGGGAIALKDALETIDVIGEVDVAYTREEDSDAHVYDVWFKTLLGDLPLLEYDEFTTDPLVPGHINITETSAGVAEVQKVVISSDAGFVREVQSLSLTADDTSVDVSGSFNITLSGASNTVLVPFDANATELEALLEELSSVYDVSVSVVDKSGGNSSVDSYINATLWTVVFNDPVGDVPSLLVNGSSLDGNSPRVDIVEVVKGVSPLEGTVTLAYREGFSQDLAFDASEEEIKATLEALDTISTVSVSKYDIGAGFEWWVTFSGELGDLELISAFPYSWEVQSLRTYGGDPTPLGGSFSVEFGGYTSGDLPYDASADGLKAALEALPGPGRVDVDKIVLENGRNEWLVTFRDLVGDVELIAVDGSGLTGTSATITTTEVAAGSNSSLTGESPALAVEEMHSGRPSYTASYQPVGTGPYQVAVTHMLPGGLSATYWDNQWLFGAPAVQRVDAQVKFSWGTGAITPYGRDYVSARWSGKLLAPSSETFTLYVKADDGARLYVDHELVIDAWEGVLPGAIEYRASVDLVNGTFHDIVLEYRENDGAASIQLMWSSYSTAPAVIPASALFYTTPISGSPYNISVVPGAAAYPFTEAFGEGVTNASAGVFASFVIQAKDAWGNNETRDVADEEGSAFQVELSFGSRTLGPSTMGAPEYIGDGAYSISYVATKAGNYSLSVRTAAGAHIYCGLAQEEACSPFEVVVSPGPTTASTCEAEGDASPAMDSLAEGVAGMTGYFNIQAKDTFGNNRLEGGDEVSVHAVLSESTTSYRGAVVDNADGTYLAVYTVPRAGTYSMRVTIGGEAVQHCTPPVNSTTTSVLSREYDGISVYSPPSGCSLDYPTLTVVHGDLHTPSCTAEEVANSGDEGLSKAVVGVPANFQVVSRDAFGNIRSFRLYFAGDVSREVPNGASAAEFQAALMGIKQDQATASGGEEIVSATVSLDSDVDSGAVAWRVTFLSHLDEWMSDPLQVMAASDGSTSISDMITVNKTASGGVYPMEYTLHYRGTYVMNVTGADGQHITGSSFFVDTETSDTEASSSTAEGIGLSGGVAGEPLRFIVQAKDEREREVQALVAWAEVVDVVPEVQSAALLGASAEPVYLSFLEQNITVTIGTDTPADIQASLEALLTIGTGNVEVSSDVGSSTALDNGDTFSVTFTGVYGDVPLLTPVPSSRATVTSSTEGDAPFRKETQAFSCTLGATGDLVLNWRGLGNVTVAADDDLDAFESAVSSGLTSVTVVGSDTTAVCSGEIVYITFQEARGDVPSLSFAPAETFTGTVTISTAGSLEGIAPLWGTFELGYGGETTSPLYADATADDVKAALEDLSTVGGVSVTLGHIGLSLGSDGTVFPPGGDDSGNDNVTSLFPVWTVAFDGDCSFENNVWTSCPANVGDLEPLVVDTSGLGWEESPYKHQAPPEIRVYEITNGTAGNNQVDERDWNTLAVSLFLEDNSTDIAAIGMNEKQGFTCHTEAGGSNSSAYIVLEFMGQSATIKANATIPDFADYIEEMARDAGLANSVVNITSAAGQAMICGIHGDEVVIEFAANYTLPEIVVTGYNGVADANVREITKGIDSISYLGGGSYLVEYTPVVAGKYYPVVTIADEEISTDMSGGVTVTPANASAVTSTLASDRVAFQGVPHFHSLEIRDRFGNLLDGHPTGGGFTATIIGTPDARAGVTQEHASHVTIAMTVSEETDASGKLSASFTPDIAGTYVMSNEFTGPGGLLATFFRTKDFMDPVLENSAYATEEPYHEPTFCPSTMVEGCDSTELVSSLTLDWGTASPLQAWPGLGFPADYFSVKLEGFIMGPTDGTVSFQATADDLFRFTVDGVVVMDTVTAEGDASTSILTAEVDMTKGALHAVTIELVEELDEASMSLLWSYDGAAENSPIEIPSSALYFTRHLEGSPVTISVFPGEVTAGTTSFDGNGLVGCVAMEECSFTVTGRDGGNNTRFTAGSDEWDVAVDGVGGWAAEGRVGEFVHSEDAPLSAGAVAWSPEDWTYAGNVTCVAEESSCTSQRDLSNLIQRGDAIVIAGETHVVDPDVTETFDSTSLPLTSPFLGESGLYEVFKVGDNTGNYTVTYTPLVRGDYSVTVKKPAIWETQLVQTVVEETGDDLAGTFTLAYEGEITVPIAHDAIGSDVASALGNLSALADANVTTETSNCSTPEADMEMLEGNAASVVIAEQIKGQAALDIGGSPVTISVVPNDASAGQTTAWGRGLYEATAGETATLTVQARDAYQNNRLDSQNDSVFLALAFAPDADPADVPPVHGTVVPLGDGSYNVSYTPMFADTYVLAVLMSTVVETQQFSFVFDSDAEASGRFTLRTGDGAQQTEAISYDATADMVASTLSAVTGIGPVQVTREDTSVTSGAASWSYTVAFMSVVGDVEQLTVGSEDLVGLSEPPSVTTVTEGEAEHIKTAEASLLPEIQVVRGHTTAALAVNSSAEELETALEELTTVGGVSVSRQDVAGASLYGFEYAVEFEPWGAHDLEHYLNYGDMPAMVIQPSFRMALHNVTARVYSGGTPSADAAITQDGASPFVPVVSPGVVSWEASTPVDEDGVVDKDGLSSAYYEAPTSFQIESRDSFGNRVFDGPVKEVQIIEVSTTLGGVLAGSFEVSYQGHSVGLDAGASLAEVEAAIEGLSSVGAVTVSTASVVNSTAFGARTGSVVAGSPYVTPSADVSSILSEGDWLRLCDVNDGLVYAVRSVDASYPYTITLDSPYGGDTESNCEMFRRGMAGSGASSYQYVVTFDSNVGDLPALTVDGTGLTDTSFGNETKAEVISCNWHRRQTVSISADTDVSGYFVVEYMGFRSDQISHAASAADLLQALTALEPIYTAGVELAEESLVGGLRAWHVTLVSAQGYEPIFADGYLLNGTNTAVSVYDQCPSSGSANCTDSGVSASVVGCVVTSAAGRVGSSYTASLSGPEVVGTSVEHTSDGLYSAEYIGPVAGEYELEVSEAKGFGLLGEYFNNRWTFGDPVVTRVDAKVDFSWSDTDTITPTGQDYISVRWTGFVQPAFSERYVFTVEANDGARLWVGDQLMFDNFDEDLGRNDTGLMSTFTATTEDELVAGRLYAVTLEFRENYGSAEAHLLWSSGSQPSEVIPSNRLFYASDPVGDSPYSVTVYPHKPSQPLEVFVAVEAWDQVKVSFMPPENDGGEAVESYMVEWWSASTASDDGGYGSPEIQTLKIGGDVDGGNVYVTSPGGYNFPRALGWDMSAEDLELALEWTFDIGEVTVSYTEDSNSTRSYRVTFESELGDLGAMGLDSTDLTSSTGFVNSIVCHDSSTAVAPGTGGASVGCLGAADSQAGNATVSSSTDVEMNVVAGVDPFVYVIEELDQASSEPAGFDVRVSALNSAGYGRPSAALNIKPADVPLAPSMAEVFLLADDPSGLRVYWVDVTEDRGSEVTSFAVDYSTDEDFAVDSTVRIEGKTTFFLSDRRLDNGTTHGVYETDVTGLQSGIPYFFRVSASNAIGEGEAMVTTPAYLVPMTAPDMLEYGTGVTLSTLPAGDAVSVTDSSTSLHVSFSPPPNDNGDAVDEYLVEWWMASEPVRSEVQVLRLASTAVSVANDTLTGNFRLSWGDGGEETDYLPADVGEVELEAALEGLQDVRDVQVSREANTASGYDWSVTFLTDVEPSATSSRLVVSYNGLAGALGADITAEVGYDLIAGLPGHFGVVTVTALGGERNISVLSLQSGMLKAGLFIELEGEAYEIEAVDASNETISLEEAYGGSNGNLTANYGTSVRGRSPSTLLSATIPATLSSSVASPISDGNGGIATNSNSSSLWYTITELETGEPYFVRVSAKNARGLGLPRGSNPAYLAPPKQVPANPEGVYIFPATSNSIRVLWNAPPADGGSSITKYKIEWDPEETFGSGSDGGPLGSHQKVVTNSSQCSSSPCEYTVPSLAKGLLYHVRVFAYNQEGFSVSGALSSPFNEAPCTQASPPPAVDVLPASSTSLLVAFEPSLDDGGKPITNYKVEWDAIGLEGYRHGGSPSDSLLYSSVDVQAVEASASKNDLGGHFSLAYRQGDS
ncbi:unnamed protein product [Ectocarpus sp. 6 AP-2014]